MRHPADLQRHSHGHEAGLLNALNPLLLPPFSPPSSYHLLTSPRSSAACPSRQPASRADTGTGRAFTFDRVLDEQSQQADVHEGARLSLAPCKSHTPRQSSGHSL